MGNPALWLVALIGYLLGSIPFGYILVRLFRSEDIRKTGSGNIGATNVVRSGAKGLGAATFLLDAAKGWAAVELARALVLHLPGGSGITGTGAEALIAAAAAVGAMASVLGHVFPVWLRFKGGKGVATAFGAGLALSPVAAMIALGVFIFTAAITRYVSLASILAAVTLPAMAVGLSAQHQRPIPPASLIVLLIMAALVIIKHHANIRRLAQGTEYRFGKKAGA